MSDFETAVHFVLTNEGGLSENANDAGGITNFGISLRLIRSFGNKYDFNKNGILEDDIRNLTQDQAKLIYENEFWNMAPFQSILNQQTANYAFDCAVLHGIGNGIKIIQRALWCCYRRLNYIVDDGIMGGKTVEAINQAGFTLLYALPAERAAYCRDIARMQNKDKEFLHGWLNRCYRI